MSDVMPICDRLTVSEIALLLEQDAAWELPHGSWRRAERMAAARRLFAQSGGKSACWCIKKGKRDEQ